MAEEKNGGLVKRLSYVDAKGLWDPPWSCTIPSAVVLVRPSLSEPIRDEIPLLPSVLTLPNYPSRLKLMEKSGFCNPPLPRIPVLQTHSRAIRAMSQILYVFRFSGI